MANNLDSDQGHSGVAQTANLGSSTSVSSGAGKIFREFKWGLLTLFILMAVVVGLVYDGGHKKKSESAATNPNQRLDAGLGIGEPVVTTDNNAQNTTGAGNSAGTNSAPGGSLGGGNSAIVGGVNDAPNRSRAQLLDDGPDAWNPAPIPDQHITRSTRNGAVQPSNGMGGMGARTTDVNDLENNLGHSGRNQSERENELRRNEPRNQQPAPRALENAAGKIYLVRSGDSLSKIASANQLGKNGIKLLIEANKEALPNPDRLREGMKLRIPAPASAPISASDSNTRANANGNNARANEVRALNDSRSTQSAQAAQGDTYLVQSGDSLERIARRVLNDGRKWKELMEWNKDKLADPAKLRAGMTLRIHGAAATPAAAEGVRFQNNPVRAEAEPSVEPPYAPEAEVAPIPVSPVSASRKISLKLYKSEREEQKASGKNALLPEPDNLPNGMLLN